MYNIPILLWPFIATFWIFALWMLWIISRSLQGINQSLKETAHNLQSKS